MVVCTVLVALEIILFAVVLSLESTVAVEESTALDSGDKLLIIEFIRGLQCSGVMGNEAFLINDVEPGFSEEVQGFPDAPEILFHDSGRHEVDDVPTEISSTPLSSGFQAEADLGCCIPIGLIFNSPDIHGLLDLVELLVDEACKGD